MAITTIVFGVALVALGIGGYYGTGTSSVTALIPAFFGVVFILFGFVARQEHARKHAMHAASALGLIGFLATLRGLIELPALLSGAGVARPAAVVSQSIMAVLMAVFVALCVKSFRDARRRRQTAA